jgi:hypothetical protein
MQTPEPLCGHVAGPGVAQIVSAGFLDPPPHHSPVCAIVLSNLLPAELDEVIAKIAGERPTWAQQARIMRAAIGAAGSG